MTDGQSDLYPLILLVASKKGIVGPTFVVLTFPVLYLLLLFQVHVHSSDFQFGSNANLGGDASRNSVTFRLGDEC